MTCAQLVYAPGCFNTLAEHKCRLGPKFAMICGGKPVPSGTKVVYLTGADSHEALNSWLIAAPLLCSSGQSVVPNLQARAGKLRRLNSPSTTAASRLHDPHVRHLPHIPASTTQRAAADGGLCNASSMVHDCTCERRSCLRSGWRTASKRRRTSPGSTLLTICPCKMQPQPDSVWGVADHKGKERERARALNKAKAEI